MHVHTLRVGGSNRPPARRHPRQPHPLPVISRARHHPACHLPASHPPPHLSPTQLVTHPAPSPAPPVTRPPVTELPDRHLGGGQEMGRRRPQGCGAGGPEDPVGPPLQLGILQHRHGNLSAATTFPNIPHPTHHRPQALLLAELRLRRVLSDSRTGQEGGTHQLAGLGHPALLD